MLERLQKIIARAGIASRRHAEDLIRSGQVRVDGVVDLPTADSLFQKVGAPVGAQPQAPPDNVLLVPERAWHTVFDPLAAKRSTVSTTL